MKYLLQTFMWCCIVNTPTTLVRVDVALFWEWLRNMFTGKFVKSERVLAVLQEHIIFDVKWDEVRKMSEDFWAKLYCKISDLFSSFCYLWDFLLENLKLKKRNSDDVHWNVWTNIIKLYARNNIFKKGIPNMRFWITYVLVKFCFSGDW